MVVRRIFDYLIVPVVLTAALVSTALLVQSGYSTAMISTVVIGTAVVFVAILERARPEREEYRRLDFPLVVEAAHFLFNYNLVFG
jgi:predicted membrane channel-forming protein YqfA (hemolysin III family)